MTQLDYTVRLEAFEGPLDLLLFLIRRAEVEVTDIPIAEITAQYLAYLEGLSTPGSGSPVLDIERAGEFLVMAATLMEVKSRMLAPAAVPDGRDASGSLGPGGTSGEVRAEDPRAELVRQLLEYKRFRDATSQLELYREEYFARYPAAKAPLLIESGIASPSGSADDGACDAPGDDAAAKVDLEDTTIEDLIEAFSRIVSAVDFARVGEHRVVYDDTPIELHAEEILDSIRRFGSAGVELDGGGRPSLEFARIFAGKTRSEAIGLFLAMLELVKQRRLMVREEASDSGARIVLQLASEAMEPATEPASEVDAGPVAETMR